MYIHEIKLDGNDEFCKRFNECSELFSQAMDEQKTQEQCDVAWETFFIYKYRLEQGF